MVWRVRLAPGGRLEFEGCEGTSPEKLAVMEEAILNRLLENGGATFREYRVVPPDGP